MIFKIFQIRNTIKEVRANPGEFAGQGAGGLFMGLFIMPLVYGVLILGGFFVLGYTTFLGGPYGFFKFLFILSIVGIVGFSFVLYKIFSLIKRSTRILVDKTIIVESKVVE